MNSEVPIDITLSAREQQVAPYYRSGAVVDFGARRTMNAILDVRLPDGRPLPSGAEVRRTGQSTIFPVGNDGEVFVSDLGTGAAFVADWSGGRCRFVVDLGRAPQEAIPRLGPFTCVPAKE